SLGERYTEFFIDTWRSEVVLTTFDQLLLALFSGRTRHLMRCHHLLDALIVLDEVQTLPCKLWDLADKALNALTREGAARVLLMSATQPALLSGARELAGDEGQVAAVFALFRRYRIRFCHRQDQDLEAFLAGLSPRLTAWIAAGRRILITLNTRASAKAVWRAVAENPEIDVPVHLISADLTPRDRLEKIMAVKAAKDGPCVVVSTQTVEAGVDIDMDVTLRDFAPLDALIQVAGRCNRNNRNGDYGGEVEIVSLRSRRGRRYAQMIYDPDLLNATHDVLTGLDGIGEDGVLELSRRYFALLKQRKDTGTKITRAFARWEEMPDIRELLRGVQRQQLSFLVLDDEPGEELRQDMAAALGIQDRWEQRSALRRLAAAMQQRTVSVFAGRGLDPAEFAEPLGPFWILHHRFYNRASGLDLNKDEDDPVCIF
ncbi:MAG: CRISPR-associated helicase Cas3', partial [Pseudomonadota bacterium]|nr:CRISPR-associated helicase Cas3' [Pseudomonadota bacterium]